MEGCGVGKFLAEMAKEKAEAEKQGKNKIDKYEDEETEIMYVSPRLTPHQRMPEHLTIGTKKAFEKNYAFPYEKKQWGFYETIYVCTKGSEWARSNEVLVLRKEHGEWWAFDSAITTSETNSSVIVKLHCRQAVFRCPKTDPTEPGWHEWETNSFAGVTGDGLCPFFQGTLRAFTSHQSYPFYDYMSCASTSDNSGGVQLKHEAAAHKHDAQNLSAPPLPDDGGACSCVSQMTHPTHSLNYATREPVFDSEWYNIWRDNR